MLVLILLLADFMSNDVFQSILKGEIRFHDEKAEMTIFHQADCMSLEDRKRKISPNHIFDGRCHSETFYSEQLLLVAFCSKVEN